MGRPTDPSPRAALRKFEGFRARRGPTDRPPLSVTRRSERQNTMLFELESFYLPSRTARLGLRCSQRGIRPCLCDDIDVAQQPRCEQGPRFPVPVQSAAPQPCRPLGGHGRFGANSRTRASRCGVLPMPSRRGRIAKQGGAAPRKQRAPSEVQEGRVGVCIPSTCTLR